MFWELKICRFSLSKSCRVLLLGFKHGIAVGVFKRACLGDRGTTQLNRSQQSAVEPGHGWCHRNRLKESCENYEIHEFLHCHSFQYVSIIFHMSPYISRKPYTLYISWEKNMVSNVSRCFQSIFLDFPVPCRGAEAKEVEITPPSWPEPSMIWSRTICDISTFRQTHIIWYHIQI